MSETAALFVIGALLGLLQALALYWISRIDKKLDAAFKKTEAHAVQLTNHNVRIRSCENVCGLEHNEVNT